jgi:cobalt/nickel transport system permease protein
MSAPGWLLESEVGLCPCGCIGKRRKGSYVTKTIGGAARVMHQALFADDASSQDGLLQRLDPRVKVVTLIGLLVSVSLVQRLPVLAAAYGATLVLAALSRLSLSFFVKRVWLFIPIFTGVVVLPATLNLITAGHVVIPLGSWFGYHLGVTSQGLTSAALIVIRVATSISLVVLLTLTTQWNALLAALRAMFVPRMFILVVGMAYRYLFHLLNTVTDMYVARQARTIGADHDVASGRAFVSASAGALFGKSHHLAEEVHMAMVSRGYDGNPRTLSTFALQPLDLAWIVTATLLAVLVIGLGRGF